MSESHAEFVVPPAEASNDAPRAQERPLRGPLPQRRPVQRLASPSDWTFELIDDYHDVIRDTARRFGLDTYPNQLEVITAEQMMDAYASVGMPVTYRHWSYGKEFISTEKNYKRGHMGLAYEIVINANPCISYLMEENTMAMQALVIAHAAYGHNSFFKGNYLFRMWTDASSIIDYLVYARNYVAECEERHGQQVVEEFLDSCHALQNHGVDRYRRPSRKSLAQELAERKDREAYAQRQVNDLWRTLPKRAEKADEPLEARRFPEEPQENQDWALLLPTVVQSLNRQIIQSVGVSRDSIHFNTPASFFPLAEISAEDNEVFNKAFDNVDPDVYQSVKQSRDRYVSRSHKAKVPEFYENQIVFVIDQTPSTQGVSSVLKIPMKGPFRISKIEDRNVTLEDLESSKIYHSHVELLRPLDLKEFRLLLNKKWDLNAHLVKAAQTVATRSTFDTPLTALSKAEVLGVENTVPEIEDELELEHLLYPAPEQTPLKQPELRNFPLESVDVLAERLDFQPIPPLLAKFP